jgi:hypothetical protein
VLLGAKPEAPVDVTAQEAVAKAASEERLAATSSRFLDAALELLGEVAGGRDGATRDEPLLTDLRGKLDVKLVTDERGERRVSFALPPRELVAGLLRKVAGLLSSSDPVDTTKTLSGPSHSERALN